MHQQARQWNEFIRPGSVSYASSYIRPGAPDGSGHRVFAVIDGQRITVHGQTAIELATQLGLSFG